MRLIDTAGHGLDVRVVGYQFPDAENLALRHSWHIVGGTAACAEGSWTFRYPALTCDESPRISIWLRKVVLGDVPPAGIDEPTPSLAALTFTEPNLSMAVTAYGSETVMLNIGLDLEFSPPWRRRRAAGDPFSVRCQPTRQQLERAAASWEEEIAAYPDGGK